MPRARLRPPIRRLRRGALEYLIVSGLLFVGLAVARWLEPGDESILIAALPLMLYAIANAFTCIVRSDGRSLIDVIAGTRSVRRT